MRYASFVLRKIGKSVGGGVTIVGMAKKLFLHSYEELVSMENLLEAWKEFMRGKRTRRDVLAFEAGLMGNLFGLHRGLLGQSYAHGPYEAFTVSDPKTRSIHKATVADRVLHRALYRTLYPFFDRTFLADSFSCRNNKGTHKALDRFRSFARRSSHNHTRTVWVLKCDIRKFFASIDHAALLTLLDVRIADKRIVWLLRQVIGSFHTTRPGVGLPLGNLTSQLCANVYMNELDQFVKHFLKAEHYIRYADDFVLLSPDKTYLQAALELIGQFLWHRLRLNLHPQKVTISTAASGVDFLGWVHFPDHRVLRASTKRRILRTVGLGAGESVFASYRGLLEHGNTKKMSEQIATLRRLHEVITTDTAARRRGGHGL